MQRRHDPAPVSWARSVDAVVQVELVPNVWLARHASPRTRDTDTNRVIGEDADAASLSRCGYVAVRAANQRAATYNRSQVGQLPLSSK